MDTLSIEFFSETAAVLWECGNLALCVRFPSAVRKGGKLVFGVFRAFHGTSFPQLRVGVVFFKRLHFHTPR